nr:hypothetical protein CFP56_09148 [Quercus suber]
MWGALFPHASGGRKLALVALEHRNNDKDAFWAVKGVVPFQSDSISQICIIQCTVSSTIRQAQIFLKQASLWKNVRYTRLLEDSAQHEDTSEGIDSSDRLQHNGGPFRTLFKHAVLTELGKKAKLVGSIKSAANTAFCEDEKRGEA